MRRPALETAEKIRQEFERWAGDEIEGYQKRLKKIREVIEAVEARCMAVDGPVTPCHEEITDEELRKIYKLAGGKVRR